MEGKSPGLKSQALGFCPKKWIKMQLCIFWKIFQRTEIAEVVKVVQYSKLT